MTAMEGIGILIAAGGIVLLVMGPGVLGLLGQLLCVALVAVGVVLIYFAKRNRQFDEALDELADDGDQSSSSHDPDRPDHD
jgi:purine-cytosine permease-like protein